MRALRYISINTPVGEFNIIINHEEVALDSGFGAIGELAKRLPFMAEGFTLSVDRGHQYERVVRMYFAGQGSSLDEIDSSQSGSEFQEDVWRSISEIPYGETASYKELAEKLGRPVAVRALGSACGANRLVLIVPCHRVVKFDGGLGQYLYGEDIKSYLLKLEGVQG